MYSASEKRTLAWREFSILKPTLTARKLSNFSKITSSFYLSQLTGKVFHKGMPVSVGVEPTTFCNLRCPECPSGLRSFTRPQGMLNMEHFEQLMKEISPELMYLLMYFQGEPYLNTNFLNMVEIANRMNIFTSTSTNAHFLTEDKAKETIKSGLKRLIISIDGTTQEVYESYRVGGQLSKVIEGTKNIIRLKKEMKSETPFVLLQFLVVKPNEHQIPEVFALGKSLGVDKIGLKTAQIYDFEQGNPLIPEQNQFSRYIKEANGKWKIKNQLKNQCWKLWQGAEITWDGRVLPCCFDKDAKYEMGKFPETSFKEIWHSVAYQTFRAQILKGRKNIDICQNCTEGTKIWA